MTTCLHVCISYMAYYVFRTFQHTETHRQIDRHTDTDIHTITHVYACTHRDTYTDTHAHTYIYTHTHMHTSTHTHTSTYTHTTLELNKTTTYKKWYYQNAFNPSSWNIILMACHMPLYLDTVSCYINKPFLINHVIDS